MTKLRPYQVKAVSAIESEWKQGHKRTLLIQPTGTGKTVTFSEIAKHRILEGGRVLIMAHREELLEQAANKLKAIGLSAMFERSSLTAAGKAFPLVIGSVQTLCRDKRLNAYPPNYFDTIIVDEAHHSMSDSYQKVLKHFDGAYVLGVTATPDRGDKKKLGDYYDSLAYEYTLPEAVRSGYLSPIRAQMIPLELNLRYVNITQGDYNAGALGNVLTPYLEQIADYMVKLCRERKTVIFLPLISISQRFCDMLNSRGFRAAEVNGNSPDRAEILADFESGKYNALCNSMLLTEGWDCPSVDCVVVLRPTKIRSLYQQMVGRGMRLAPGKKDLLLLDFLWMTAKHDLCRPSSLLAKSEDVAKRINAMVENGDVDLMEANETAERDAAADRERTLAKELAAQRKRKAKCIDPIQYALSICADDLADWKPEFAWETEPPTEKQLESLERMGFDISNIAFKGYAAHILDRCIQRNWAGMSTAKQIRLLERYGFEHVGTWTCASASALIDTIANNGWRVPFSITPQTYIPQDGGINNG